MEKVVLGAVTDVDGEVVDMGGLARLLVVPKTTAQRLAKRLPRVKVGNKYRFFKKDIFSWLESQRQGGSND